MAVNQSQVQCERRLSISTCESPILCYSGYDSKTDINLNPCYAKYSRYSIWSSHTVLDMRVSQKAESSEWIDNSRYGMVRVHIALLVNLSTKYLVCPCVHLPFDCSPRCIKIVPIDCVLHGSVDFVDSPAREIVRVLVSV